jgi:hypothetical protein
MPEHLTDRVARSTSRRGFLAGVAGGLMALTVGESKHAQAQDRRLNRGPYTNFCGHTFTTANCPHPTGLPRVDRRARPLRARDGKPVDDLGRPIDRAGYPVDRKGQRLRAPDGSLLPKARRTPLCEYVGQRFRIDARIEGSWYRCCGGRVRRLMDCCSLNQKRINGDAGLTGYCYGKRKVFCVMYYDTSVKC